MEVTQDTFNHLFIFIWMFGNGMALGLTSSDFEPLLECFTLSTHQDQNNGTCPSFITQESTWENSSLEYTSIKVGCHDIKIRVKIWLLNNITKSRAVEKNEKQKWKIKRKKASHFTKMQPRFFLDRQKFTRPRKCRSRTIFRTEWRLNQWISSAYIDNFF